VSRTTPSKGFGDGQMEDWVALNPIQFTGQVTEEFRRYQLTAFPIADPRLAAQASALLGAGPFKDSPLTRGPFVSLARGFREGATLPTLVDEGLVHAALPGVAEYPSLFDHQEQTLRSALGGRHVLVSTGTGSGKTEAFLYPIIDRCLRLRDASEPDGVVAVLVYPMNALASDQRDRLRMLLAGTGITYGMYVGSTPRRPSDSDVRQLAEGEGREALLAARRRRKANDSDVVPFEECASEEEIRERKPRILITNANQLELLVTRQRDLSSSPALRSRSSCLTRRTPTQAPPAPKLPAWFVACGRSPEKLPTRSLASRRRRRSSTRPAVGKSVRSSSRGYAGCHRRR
jgi:hypothetical protein